MRSQSNPGFALEALLVFAVVRIEIMIEKKRGASGCLNPFFVSNHQVNCGYPVKEVVLHQGVGGFRVLDLACFYAVYVCKRQSAFAGEVM